jgi:large subunit ribosomal protein L15
MAIRVKKKKKAKKFRGSSTHGHGARKKWKGSGHHGGMGMAGTGKRADQKKTLINKLYGNKYFGKRGVTGGHAKKKKGPEINLRDIQRNIDSLLKNHSDGINLKLEKHRILGDGELKKGLTITAKSFTKSAREKIEMAGGKALLAKEKSVKSDVKKESEEKE